MPMKKRTAPKRKLVRRRRLARRIPRNPKGSFVVRRRYALIAMKGDTLGAGLPVSTNTNVLSLGSAVASLTSGANYYDIPFSLQFQLDQIQSYTDLTNIADRYRLLKHTIKFILNQNTYYSGAPMPFVEFVADSDDSAVPSIAQVTEKMGLRTLTFAQTGVATTACWPKPAISTYNGVSSAYSVPWRKSPYINSTYYSVPHYGIKGVFRNIYLPGTAVANATLSIDINASVHLRDLQ